MLYYCLCISGIINRDWYWGCCLHIDSCCVLRRESQIRSGWLCPGSRATNRQSSSECNVDTSVSVHSQRNWVTAAMSLMSGRFCQQKHRVMSEISNDIIDINDNNKLVKNRESLISSFLHQYSDWNFQRSAWDRIKFAYACIFLIIRHESSSTWMHLLQLPYRYLCWRGWDVWGVCLTTGCVQEAVNEARQEGGEDVTEIEDKMTLNYQMNPFTFTSTAGIQEGELLPNSKIIS